MQHDVQHADAAGVAGPVGPAGHSGHADASSEGHAGAAGTGVLPTAVLHEGAEAAGQQEPSQATGRIAPATVQQERPALDLWSPRSKQMYCDLDTSRRRRAGQPLRNLAHA